ncbi:MAG: YfhO family protein [Anaerolineae bacterium]|nr:YfhO family protein [Anaerolineae bacterium]NIN93865.1 YfhO family protein [Anaerolineae bacterium]NIQ76898.1 YfhO family protein [Anaerolineae bacterium]
MRQLLDGHLPLWNPYTYSGHPFLADIQAAIFYPPSLLTVLLSAPWQFPVYALELEAIAHIFLGSFFTYLFAKRLLTHRLAALVVALIFAYGGYLTSYPIQQLAILEVQIWLPLILWLLSIAWERWDTRREKHWFVWAGLALGVSLLAGHPQSSMYVFYVCLLYSAFESYRAGGKLWHKVVLFCLFLVTGVGVAAVQLVPSVEYMLLSTRAQATYQQMAGGFPLHDLLQVFLPGVLSKWSPLYVGILPLLLASLGIYIVRDRRVLFWSALALLALLLSLGGSTFLYASVYLLVPGFGIFRGQERAAYVFSFSMAILAGYGARALFDSVSSLTRERMRAFNWGVFSAVLASLVLVAAFLYGWARAGLAVDSPFGALLNRSILLAVFLLLGVGCIYARQRRLGGIPLLVVTGLVVVFDLFTVNWQNNVQPTNPQDEYGPSVLLAPIQADDDAFRVYNDWRLPGNYGIVYEVQDIGGASPLRLQWYDELVSLLPEERVWELLNVKYVITARRSLLPLSESLYEEPSGGGTTYLHRLEDYLPRAWVVHGAEVLQGGEALELLSDPDFDPLGTVILEEEPELPLPGAMSGAESTVAVLEREPSRIVLEAECSDDGILVVSEVYYPGWRAPVDGQETKIHRANHALRAVELEAGFHRVELVYAPLSFKTGLVISAATLIAVAGVAARSTIRRA